MIGLKRMTDSASHAVQVRSIEQTAMSCREGLALTHAP